MEKAILGKTGIEVSRVGLGGLFVSTVGGDRAQGCAAVRRALELGINYLDTAPTYLDSETVLGEALRPEDKVVLSTKLGGRPQPFLPQDTAALRSSLEESLRLLRRDYVDILFIHEPDRPEMYDWWSDKQGYRGPVLDLLLELKDQGTVRAIGLAGTTAYELANIMRTGRFDVVLTAFNYSLLWREAEHEILPLAAELGMGVVVGSVLQQGDLARRYDKALATKPAWISLPRYRQFQALYALQAECGIPLPELALRFVLSHPGIATVLIGPRSAAEVEQNVAAHRRGPLPRDILARLDEIAALVPFRPSGEPLALPFPHKYDRNPEE